MSEEILVVNPDSNQESEKRGIGKRGADKNPRKINTKSLLNLKPFQKNPEKITRKDSKIWIVPVVILIIIFLAFLSWFIHQKRKSHLWLN